jgi:hypothetical protein
MAFKTDFFPPFTKANIIIAASVIQHALLSIVLCEIYKALIYGNRFYEGYVLLQTKTINTNWTVVIVNVKCISIQLFLEERHWHGRH